MRWSTASSSLEPDRQALDTWVPAMCAAEATMLNKEDRESRGAMSRLFEVTTAAQWQQVLVDLLRKGERDSRQLSLDLKKAGTPDVERGDEIASRLQHSAVLLNAVYRAAREFTAGLDPQHPRLMQRRAQSALPRLKATETNIFNDVADTLNVDPVLADMSVRNADCQSAFATT